MGPIPEFPSSLPGEFQKEWRGFALESDAELRAEGLLNLAGRLEEAGQGEAAVSLYAYVAEEGSDADSRLRRSGDLARRRYEALFGRGNLGFRAEGLLRRFVIEAADPKNVVPMFAASLASGLVKAFSYGRLTSLGGEAWYARGMGARFASGGLAFSAEVTAFSTSHRLLHPSTLSSGTTDLASTVLTLGTLKLFGLAGRKLSIRSELAPVFSFAGIYSALYLEEKAGLRSPAGAALRAMEGLASWFSIGIGNRLGRRFLGARFQAFSLELETRTRQEGLPERLRVVSNAWSRDPTWMAMTAEGPGGGDFSGKGERPGLSAQEVEAKEKGYVIDRPLKEYRRFSSLTAMGDLVRRLESRIAELGRPPRVLDLGSGKGIAALELKRHFQDRIRMETLDRHPLVGSDKHYEGDWLEVQPEGNYDLILSIFGPPSHHEGRLYPMLQKAFAHLAPDGEFVATLTPSALHSPDALRASLLEDFFYTQVAMGRGLALRMERVPVAHLIYARRLGDAPVPSLAEILETPLVYRESWEIQAAFQALYSRLRGIPFLVGRTEVRLEDGTTEALAANLASLGVEAEKVEAANFLQGLSDDFRKTTQQGFRREPLKVEVEEWLEGAPSPLRQQPLLIDALLRMGWKGVQVMDSSSAQRR